MTTDATTQCPYCAETIPAARFCSACGRELAKPAAKPTKRGLHPFVICLLIVVVPLAGLGVLMLLEQSAAPVQHWARPTATAAVIYGTVVGYDEVTTGRHVTTMDLFDKPAGAPPPYATVGYIHEGDRVVIVEQRADGTVKVRNASGTEGWTQIDSLKDMQTSARGPAATPIPPGPKHVRYEVTGTTPAAEITYDGPPGHHEAFITVQLPWSVEFDASQQQYLFISARNPHMPTTVHCTIVVDGKVWQTDSHTGDNTMAVCGGE